MITNHSHPIFFFFKYPEMVQTFDFFFNKNRFFTVSYLASGFFLDILIHLYSYLKEQFLSY